MSADLCKSALYLEIRKLFHFRVSLYVKGFIIIIMIFFFVLLIYDSYNVQDKMTKVYISC